MTKETRVAITMNALRWAANILTEVLSNHGCTLPDEAREKLHGAVSALWEVERIARRGEGA